MSRFLFATIMLAVAVTAAGKEVIVPAGGAKPIGPYSPGILVEDYLYVSGQGAGAPDGRTLATFEEQARQCLDNVRAIVEAAELTMEHVVHAQVYLADMANREAMDGVWRQVFPKDPPARAVVGVEAIPAGNPIEITVVAVRDLTKKKVIDAPGGVGRAVLTGDRLYLGGVSGADLSTGAVPEEFGAEVETAMGRAAQVLEAAGLSLKQMVFTNPYLTPGSSMKEMNEVYAKHFEFGNTPARATIRVAALPGKLRFMLTGVAVRDLGRRRAIRPRNMKPSPTASPCVLAGDTLFCSAKSGFIPGPNSGIYADDVGLQVRQSMRNLLDGLEEAGMDFSNVVAANVYLDTLDEFTGMNGVYGSYYSGAPPTRTTLQPLPPATRGKDEQGRSPMLEQISVIAVR